MAAVDLATVIDRYPDPDVFACELCKSVWDDPVTGACGHTFCRRCICVDGNSAILCSLCSKSFTFDSACKLCTNVLLSSIVEKCFAGNKEEKKACEVVVATDDLECTLCLRLIFRPVTTQCGHTFCLGCIYRSLDHRVLCPLCKESLAKFLADRRETTTVAIGKIIERYFPEGLETRRKMETEEIMQIQKSVSANSQEIPIFVCTVAFPNVPYPLRVFEPRYRLMMRRCMESGTRQFGMCACLSSNEEDFHEYGTVLKIRDVRYLPDGQVFVDCVGERRFHVLTKGIQDGYRTGVVEFLQNEHSTHDEQSDNDLQQLLRDVYKESVEWFASIPPMSRARIVHSLGDFPAEDSTSEYHHTSPDFPVWVWYVIAILPVDQTAQLCFLPMTSLRECILSLRRVLLYFSHRGQSS